MKMYRTQLLDVKIKEIEVISQTNKTVTYINASNREVNERKSSGWSQWHETKEDAIAFLKGEYMRKIESCHKEIERCNNELAKIQELYGK